MYRAKYIIILSFLLSISVAAQQPGHIYKAIVTLDGDSSVIHRLFPGTFVKHADPFILLDDFSVQPPAGFSDHPHKGFEAITYMIDGGFIHKDNLGNNDTIFAGGAQHFVAGSGLIHSEMPGTTGINRGLQLWLNIPADTKKTEPTYQLAEALPIQSTKSVTIRTIVGNGSPIQVNCGCDLTYLDVQLKKDIVFTPVIGYTSFVYVLDGLIQINDKMIYSGNFYFLEAGVSSLIIGDSGEPRFVYLSAKPLNQRIKQRGPYVY